MDTATIHVPPQACATSSDLVSHAAAELRPEAWILETFVNLCALLGTQKVNGIAQRFESDLKSRFGELQDHEALRRDAHAVTSTAGMLGFAQLSASARALDLSCTSNGDVASCLADLLDAKRTATELLARHFGHS